ncbi:MAG: sodium-dependent transporter [Tissierellia bacterium]|nr:sodium-dependent transporter [Tissierellia bacterium]
MSKQSSNQKEQWGSRLGFIFAALGMAVGTGNIWRFPRIAGSNYGGTFIIAYIICNLIWVLPLLMTEMGIGKSARLGTVGSFRDFYGKKKTWMGTFIVWVCAAITFYYAVVFGQAMRYFVFAVVGDLTADMDSVALWEGYLVNSNEQVIFLLLAVVLMGFFIYRGVKGGLELVGKIAIPVLFFSLLGTSIWVSIQPGGVRGLEFLFVPKWDHFFDLQVWLNALTQAAWSAGAGWGMMLTYANYFKENEDIVCNSFMITFGDMCGAMLGALAVLPAVFAFTNTAAEAGEILGAGNVGLTFIYLAKLFPTMPGGRFIAILFFLSLSLAALTSIIPQAETVVRNFVNSGMGRGKATIILCVATFIFGLPSALNIDFLNNQDWVYGIGLLLCGLFFAMAVYKFGVDKFRVEIINKFSDIKINKYYNFIISCFPIFLVIVVGWWLLQSIQWHPTEWWNPMIVDSLGTVVVQLAIAIIIFILVNDKLAGKISDDRYMNEGKFITKKEDR